MIGSSSFLSVINWWQTLGEDELPRLFGDHKQVFYDADRGYYNEGDFAKGDLNGDGAIDIADAVNILDLMAKGDNDPAADINNDGTVDIADFVSILNIMATK